MTLMKRGHMRAVRFDRYGTPDVLEVRIVPIPEPGPQDVLVRVHAAGLNPKDTMIRSGALRLQTGRTFPRGTGFDFAGEVTATGAGVTDLPVGSRVWGFLDGVLGGAAADYVAVPREGLSALPEGRGWIEAAALPLVGSAALQGLRDVAALRPGERVLIRGAGGGVGGAAIQIALALGAHVTAIAGAEALDRCRSLGAHQVVDRRSAHPTTLPGPYDVFLDCVGRSPLRAWGSLLGSGGRWVAVAPSPAVYALAPLSRMLGALLRTPRLGFVVVRPVAADLEELGRLVADGRLRLPVSDTYPLEDIRAAQDDLAMRRGRGKRVLVVSEEAAGQAEAGGRAVATVAAAPKRVWSVPCT